MEQIERLGEWLIQVLHLKTLLQKEKRSIQFVNRIYPGVDSEECLRKIWSQRVGMLAIVTIIMIVMLLLSLLTSENSMVSQGILTREEEEVTLRVGVTDSMKEYQKEMTFTIPEEEYSEAEKKELDVKVEREIRKEIVGENKSLLMVCKKLVLLEKMNELPVNLKWTVDEKYLKEDGRIRKSKIPESGVDTILSVKASSRNWIKEYHIPIFLVAEKKSEEAKALASVKEAIRLAIKKQKCETEIHLPLQVGEKEITYESTSEKERPPVYLLLLVIILFPLLWQEQMKKQEQKRREQLLLDYPELVDRVMLLLGAGLTMKKSMERIVYEYKIREEEPPRYVYEELTRACNEMNNGVSESMALEHFGIRCQHSSYLRFSTLITQNMRKGTSGLLKLLESEAMEAYRERTELVRRMGEEAGTKLLIPMGFMFLLVMAIVLVPALVSI